MIIYIKGTRKQANEKLSLNQRVNGVEYSLAGDAVHSLTDCPDGTAIKFWNKRDYRGTPIAASYGQFRKFKNKIVT